MSNRTGVFIALAALGLACSGISSAQTRDPRIGHWHEQPGAGPSGLQITYEDLGDGRFRYTMGSHSEMQIVEGKCDGGTYPFRSVTYPFLNGPSGNGNTLSCRFTGPLTVEYVYTQGNKRVWATSTGVEAVSADGNTLTWDAIHRDTNGGVVEERHARFSRGDDEPRAK